MRLMFKSKYLIFFKSENFGNVILEAMLAKLQLLCQKLPGKY